MFLDCLANLILPISCHGIIFGTHMEALDMMGEEFSLPFPPYHQSTRRIWLSGPIFVLSTHFHLNVPGLFGQPNIANILSWHFTHFQPRYINVPGLFGQPDIANILSWHYLWDPYGGFGHDGRRIQPALPSLPSVISKNLAVWANFCTFTHFQDI